jgi:hypothetical protein
MEPYTAPFSCVDNAALADALAERAHLPPDVNEYADYWIQLIERCRRPSAASDDGGETNVSWRKQLDAH